ncbi:ATP-binding protein [Mucilaginibacter flavidus]|uniref:ATP-binding protein n=1 Tax=Mucilaginibacter flavidus TaxID=2949309 RepID=UPI0020938F6B|nr:ATP-binding protein [Mucilaginibacter flavidus]MCO5949841.1 ATP-binding protein [Mucilaginibacter flavidus]
MKIAAIYIPQGNLPIIFGEGHKELTINLGGRNLYQFKDGKLDTVELNRYYIDDLLSSDIPLLSCVVGNNGGGKTTLLQYIANAYYCTYVLEEQDGTYELTRNIEKIHRIYFTPYLNYGSLDAARNNYKDLTKLTLLKLDNHGDSGLLDDFLAAHNSENTKRWIKFNHFYKNREFTKITLPVFNEVTLSLGYFDTSIHKPDKFHDTSYQLRPAITLIYDKIKQEASERERQMGENFTGDIRGEEAKSLSFLIRFEYDLYETALGKFVSLLERAGNDYLDEGIIPEDFEDVLATLTVREALQWFLENTGVYADKEQYLFVQHLNLLELVDYVRSLVLENTLTDNWRSILINETQALRVIQLYDAFNVSFINEWFNFDTKPMFIFRPEINVSSGEQSFLNLFSILYDHADNIKAGVDIDRYSSNSLEGIGKDILLLLDEGDNAFHPQWKKEYVKYLREIIPVIFVGYQLQIIITSHDPLTLSDLPKNNVVFLEKMDQVTKIGNSAFKRTLGANIADLLKDSFFMQDGQIGAYIAQVIDFIIEDISAGHLTGQRQIAIERIIYCIDEPILKFKLAEMLSEALGDQSFEARLIDDEIQRLQERRRLI